MSSAPDDLRCPECGFLKHNGSCFPEDETTALRAEVEALQRQLSEAQASAAAWEKSCGDWHRATNEWGAKCLAAERQLSASRAEGERARATLEGMRKVALKIADPALSPPAAETNKTEETGT